MVNLTHGRTVDDGQWAIIKAHSGELKLGVVTIESLFEKQYFNVQSSLRFNVTEYRRM